MLAKTQMRPYAQALFDQAVSEGQLTEWRIWLETLTAVVAAEDIQSFLSDPFLDVSAACDLLNTCWPQPMSVTQMRFLRLLLTRHCVRALPALWVCFEDLYHAHAQVQVLHIDTAFPLSEAELSRLAAVFKEQLGAHITWVVTVSPALLGGIVIRIGDDVIDASVRGRLMQLTRALA